MLCDAVVSSQSTPAASPNRSFSPAPRRSVQLGPSTLPRRPGLAPRTSSLSPSSFGPSLDRVPAAVRLPNGTSLKHELGSAPVEDVTDPFEVLKGILGSVTAGNGEGTDVVSKQSVERPPVPAESIDFDGLSLEDFANRALGTEGDDVAPATVGIPVVEDFETEKEKFEDLHKSILACDEVLRSVETYLTSFRADLAAVSSEIEHLQDRSTQLNNKLENRKAVEKVLGPEVGAIVIPPAVVRKITEGTMDDGWVKALEELDKRSRIVEAKTKEAKDVKAAQDVRPFVEDVSTKAVERIRDHVVAQIKALRSPNTNAQVIQQNALLRYRNVFGFLSSRQPQLAEEISQAYINTMRWYYSSHFVRYKLALDKLSLYTIDQTDAIALDPASKRSAKSGNAYAIFSIGRRGDILRSSNDGALPSSAAEDDKTMHYLEVPFRAFNLALVDNASAEYSFLTEFFTAQPFQATNRKFTDVFTPTFQLGHDLLRHLIDTTLDALGVLLCVRLTQHSAFELQRRKVPAMDAYINATSMLLWPRFQQIIDAHCDSIRKLAASLPGKPAGSALALTASPANTQSTAPHPLTQRFANFTQGILSLSSEAGDDEPVSHSLGRLRAEFEAFLVRLSKGIADARKRERLMYNNYSLVCTILGDTEGKMAEELKRHFVDRRDALNVDV
ncbi:Vacuolar protein sorting-associated protein 52 [Friedmanniomyces endolithicus]|uniref:Vacuolar protein sorting-associated protein 52 n=1 Tax=Friedmanniomyces endolithicus TaxID=329885 RepID=A0AAN6H1X0_9PEZI|nr:Vacuolar protein sorting-associated protein 52 [Friedmanniomyces endolithicus]KAK0883990.1 Vacuolar protein sorting-associated protein 52 [Friedmanniomyces endolithicus]KAK0952188.1 Vacuolar protein sorting-associated protein 52 [Friedmanniomyces endolithicus]KAK0985489.1 Vacuolar protein sorting-associated protein 52 [Friedmanniomyces endolithicus]KAK1033254.1 Vacuolar protein sorting-associated protein 52 [Friedmanniomyces endolithicus]